MKRVSLPDFKRCQGVDFDIDHHAGYSDRGGCQLISVSAKKRGTNREIFADCWPVGEKAKAAFKKDRLSCRFLLKRFRKR